MMLMLRFMIILIKIFFILFLQTIDKPIVCNSQWLKPLPIVFFWFDNCFILNILSTIFI